LLQPGQVLGSYEVIEEIGQGGFAIVYRARHQILHSDHALKVLLPEHVSERHIRDRFLNEARVIARLRHPNIIRATDVIRAPGIAGIVMDFIEGGSLEDWIANAEEPPTTEFIKHIFVPVLDALHHAHQHNVIHRDLKPANILMQPTPDGGFRPCVVDFGVARIRGALRSAHNNDTITGSQMGTLGYMSPEQIRSATESDARSDIFSLGITLFEFATLSPPFQGKDAFEVMRAIVDGEYALPNDLMVRSPNTAKTIVVALQSEPEHRFASCHAFAQTLSGARRPPVIPPTVRKPKAQDDPAPLPDLVHQADAPPGESQPTNLSKFKQAPRTAVLIFKKDTPDRQAFSIGDGLTIGKAAGNDLRLPNDNWVGRFHCRIERRADQFVLVDNRSTNGTLVNGKLVLEQPLFGGEEIVIGQTVLHFQIESSQPPLKQ